MISCGIGRWDRGLIVIIVKLFFRDNYLLEHSEKGYLTDKEISRDKQICIEDTAVRLVSSSLKKYSQETAKHVDHVSQNTLTRLKQYEWPGNVRELENAIERAVVLSRSRTLRPGDFSFLSTGAPRKKTPSLKEVEQDYIVEVLDGCEWNITRAAKILGINRVTLHKKIARSALKTKKK